jgi:hypothetical protein
VWHSTPATARKAKPKNLTLTPEAHAALAFLAPAPGQASYEASAAIVERARAKGWTGQL